VQTSAFELEKAWGKSSSRGAFGTMKDGGYLANLLDLRVKHTANVRRCIPRSCLIPAGQNCVENFSWDRLLTNSGKSC
jgi:hypothetical protein